MYKRRILVLVILCCCFISSFAVQRVLAETSVNSLLTEYEAASGLNKLGMITGDAKGDYMLQSKLKRSEATQFIVNLIGKNKYVKDNKDTYSSTSFKDVKKTDWFAPSVGYCQQSGFITVNDTATFRPGDYVSEKEFLGMVLKALGYTTDDFSWGTVYQKAYDIKLVDDPEYQVKNDDNKEFKRADVAKVMCTALRLKPKTENMTLIQNMVNSGVISYETAISSKILIDEVVSKIQEIKPLNEQKLKVIFNEKIGTVKPENIQINDSNGNVLSITGISQTDSEIIIKTSKQVPARKYVIEIKPFIDFNGITIPKVAGEFTGFTVVEVVSDLFKVSKMEQKDADEVNVYFTHPVNDNAANAAYYEIYENDSLFLAANAVNTSVKVLPGNKGITIALKGKRFTADQEYSIKVSPELISAYGANFVTQTELDSFIARDVQSVGFAIEQVIGLSRNTIRVDFSMDINPTIAGQIFMYSITDSNNKQIQVTSAQMATSMGNSVILTINGSLDAAKTYNIMVNYMIDASGQYTINTQNYSFTGYIPDTVQFQVFGVSPIDTGAILVYFSKPINEKSLADTSNFTLLDSKNSSFKEYPIKAVISPEDPSSIKLYFAKDKKLQANKTYILRISSRVTDYTGYSLTGQNDFTFEANGVVDTSIYVEKAVNISQDTIKVVFSKEIALDTPNILTGNYSVDYYDNGVLVKKVPIAITYVDNKIIVLKFDKLPEEVESTFNFKEIKDISGEVYTNPQTNAVKVTKGV